MEGSHIFLLSCIIVSGTFLKRNISTGLEGGVNPNPHCHATRFGSPSLFSNMLIIISCLLIKMGL